MARYILKYLVIIEAEDADQAECISADVEGDIHFCNKRIIEVNCDPYVEELL